MHKEQISVFWFRRDLRVEDNRGFFEALNASLPVLPIFIFDTNITDGLVKDDARITFIYKQLKLLHDTFRKHASSLLVLKGAPEIIWKQIINTYDVKKVFFNEDYEPYAKDRDGKIKALLNDSGTDVNILKDQVIFAKDEVLKADQKPYTVFTPYKNKWLERFNSSMCQDFKCELSNKLLKFKFDLPSLKKLGFVCSLISVPMFNLDRLQFYEETRNYPSLDQTSHLSTHLRFGTISIRNAVEKARRHQAFLNELIWREFFMQILYHFPKVAKSNFKHKYDHIKWRNDEKEFDIWRKGKTGYPMVDAGMRQLNATGLMHNRLRMITAGFLCKHLLIDWRWGEAYFAKKLLDYELSSNNGNWQWAAGTGCDAAPYFRVFNPTEQIRKFDSKLIFVKKWVHELDSKDYPPPMVDHKFARERAIMVYKQGIDQI